MAEVFLGRYEAIRTLGRGSMGEVWLARPTARPDERVVVKVMNERTARQPRFQQLFEREIQYMSRLRHPYIVRLLDSSATDPHGPCLVLEFIDGVTLDAVITAEKKLAPERVGRLLGILCHALDAAHRAGIVHRDLKPANLMITDVGTPQESLRVMDFGLAQLSLKPYFSVERLAGAKINVAVGTPSYVCPEQLRGDEVDSRADIYSVGIILFEMLTGKSPFVHTDVQKLLRAHVNEPPLRFSAAGAHNIPPEIERVVQHCLAKFPIERPQTGRELAANYGKALHEDYWEPTRPAEEPEIPLPAMPTLELGELAAEPGTIVRKLEAWMPERIAVVKLRGFLEDYGGKVLASEPGVLRVQIGETARDGLLTLIGLKARKPDPIEIEFRMDKPNPNENRLHIAICFRSPGGPPRTPDAWKRSCEKMFNELRSYLIAAV